MNKFDETIQKMEEITSEIKEKADSYSLNQNEDTILKIKLIAEKTIGVINEAASKLKESIKDITDENELNRFLERVGTKCAEAKEYTYRKFAEIVPEQAEDATYQKKDIINEDVVKEIGAFLEDKKKKVLKYLDKVDFQNILLKAELDFLTNVNKGLDEIIKQLNKDK